MVPEMLQKYIFFLLYQAVLIQRNLFAFNQYEFVFIIFLLLLLFKKLYLYLIKYFYDK